jgi:hypothetical protein
VNCLSDTSVTTERPAFQFRISPRGSPYPDFTGGNIFRIFLFPLTQWNVGETCEIGTDSCEMGSGAECGAATTCELESVVGGRVIGPSYWQVNVIKMTLPIGIKPIVKRTSGGTGHRPIFVVGALPVPKAGFFPTYFTIESQL